MRVEHLQYLLEVATREDSTDPAHWDKFVSLTQASFHEGQLPEECTWKTVVLISKGKGDFCGIVLVKVLWKTLKVILNHRLMVVIQFHKKLHGLCTGRVTGKASLKSKLLQQ